MNINEFKAGEYEQQYEYRSFLPTHINKEWTVSDPQTHTLLEEANRLLGELNAFSQLIPDVDFFIQMHITRGHSSRDHRPEAQSVVYFRGLRESLQTVAS
jgi:hypothetical protein